MYGELCFLNPNHYVVRHIQYYYKFVGGGGGGERRREEEREREAGQLKMVGEKRKSVKAVLKPTNLV